MREAEGRSEGGCEGGRVVSTQCSITVIYIYIT